MYSARECSILIPAITASAAASGVLTSNNSGQFTNNKIVTIGGRVYTFKTTLSTGPTVANEIKLGVDADASLGNLVKAINLTGVAGTDYSVGTLINSQVSAGAVTSHATTITAKDPGFAGNAIVSTTDEAKLSWGAGTLVGGVGGSLGLKSSTGITPVVLGGATGTFYTDKVEVGTYIELLSFLNVTAQSGTNPTLDITQQISPDGATWTDGDAFTQVTTGTVQTIKRTTAVFGAYVRYKIVLGGTAPRYTLSLSVAAKT